MMVADSEITTRASVFEGLLEELRVDLDNELDADVNETDGVDCFEEGSAR